MACARDERHRYGQHYTPAHVAGLLAAFAVRESRDSVLDPSCGDGRLLRAALDRKLELASGSWGREQLRADLFGIDRSLDAISGTLDTCSSSAAVDFFDIRSGSYFPFPFDAIIGNPPYIRQEVMGSADKRRVAELIDLNRKQNSKVSWPAFSGRSDVYVFFFAHAVNFLREGGRLVFLTSASWLDAGYGSALREFLLGSFKVVAIVESAAENFFDHASINTIITVTERCSDEQSRKDNLTRFAQLSIPIGDDAVTLASSIERAIASGTPGCGRVRIVNQHELAAESGGWGKFLRADEVFFDVTRVGTRLKRLGELARVRFGVKTGANDFFYLERPAVHERAHASLKTLGEVATVRRGLTTGANGFFYVQKIGQRRARGEPLPVLDANGNQHLIEAQYLSPVIFSLKELGGIEVDRSLSRKLFFNCQVPVEDLAGTGALDYIRQGEEAGYHLRPSCSTREQWYTVARGLKPAPLLFPSKVGERWLIAVNRARLFEDKKLYGIFPRPGVDVRTLAALLNSTWTRYCTEVTCRQLTGAQAIADIDVSVAQQLLVPDPRDLSPRLRSNLAAALAGLTGRRVLSVFDEVTRADRRRLDHLTLEAMGFVDQKERQLILDRLYSAVTQLVTRRLAGSRTR